MEIVRSIFVIFKKFRLRKFKVNLYTNEGPINKPSMDSIVIKIATKHSKTKFSEINNRLKKGTCYYVEINNEISHASWLFKKNLLARQLNLKNYWTIGNCKTYEKYKGMGLYGRVVSEIILNHPNQKFVLFIDPENTASIKGVTKIGLSLIGKYEIIRFMGIPLKLTKLDD